MKKIAIPILVLTGLYFVLKHSAIEAKPQFETVIVGTGVDYGVLPPLRVVFFQDCSPSIRLNGVEIITSDVFEPYYEKTNRSIELYVGFIGDTTAHKLITLILPAAELIRPLPIDLKDIQITQQRRIQMEYLARVKKYESDSAAFYTDRAMRINVFRQQIDTVLNAYRRKKSRTTDLIPVPRIADKVFNFSEADSADNVLILNTDGIDSRHRVARPMKNKAMTILVNANGRAHTSLDSIVTNTLQSTEQAIQFSLLTIKKY